MKICTVIGARPQFIKAAALSAKFAELSSLGKNITETIIHTGQHYDEEMSNIFFEELGIPKEKYNLNAGSGSHAEQTGKMLILLEKKLQFEKPDIVLLYGDTNSTLAGALAASKLKIKIAHVEAGMRSFNREMPEEINRIVTDHLAAMNFCSAKAAVSQLKKEGLAKTAILVGDVMVDVIILFSHIAEKRKDKILRQFGLEEKKYVLMTCHRAENTDDPSRLREIIRAANQISKQKKILFPIHPRTRKYIKNLSLRLSPNVIISKPLSYIETIALEKYSFMLMTDSGGMQKEAFFLDIPCITMRNETEWRETVQAGMNQICGANREKIIAAFAKFAKEKPSRGRFNPYGNGDAAEKISKHIY